MYNSYVKVINMKKVRLKKKYRIVLESTFMLICLVVFIYAIIHIINWKKDVDNNHKVKDEIEEHIIIDEKNDVFDIDFKALKEINSDAIAYIKVNGTNIDYVVVKGKDNSYYLTHNFNREYNIAGWIFADYHNKLDDTDKNIVIYGHNTKDGSMFETLINVLDKNWQEDSRNQVVTLVTENGKYKYQVFSTYSIKHEDYYINTLFYNDYDFLEFLNTIRSRSNYDYNIDLKSDDKILTLSSCIGEGQKRVVLHAKLIDITE